MMQTSSAEVIRDGKPIYEAAKDAGIIGILNKPYDSKDLKAAMCAFRNNDFDELSNTLDYFFRENANKWME